VALAGCAHTAVEHPRTHFQQGIDAKKSGKTDEAMKSFREALAEDPHDLDAWRALVQVYAEAGRLSEVTGELTGRSKASPSDDAVWYALGLAQFASPGSAGALALGSFQKAAALKPQEPEYVFRQGVALLESEKFDEALPPLREAVRLGPKQAKYHVPLGLCLARKGDRTGALAEFRALLDLKPTGKDVLLAQKAIARMDDPLRDIPKSEEENFKRGVDWLNRADAPQQAIDAFLDILDRYPDLASVQALTGLAYERLDDAGPAVEHLRRAIELRPESYEPYLYLAELYLTKQKPDQAAELYQQALDRNPLSDRAYQALGNIALARGDAALGLTDLRALVTLRPDDPNAHKQLAQALDAANQPDDAESELRGVIEANDRDLDARLRLGILYTARRAKVTGPSERERYTKLAIDQFQKVLDVQPENAGASRALKELQEAK
jgi:tetratricopeptide (TPR) repeat protein